MPAARTASVSVTKTNHLRTSDEDGELSRSTAGPPPDLIVKGDAGSFFFRKSAAVDLPDKDSMSGAQDVQRDPAASLSLIDCRGLGLRT